MTVNETMIWNGSFRILFNASFQFYSELIELSIITLYLIVFQFYIQFLIITLNTHHYPTMEYYFQYKGHCIAFIKEILWYDLYLSNPC